MDEREVTILWIRERWRGEMTVPIVEAGLEAVNGHTNSIGAAQLVRYAKGGTYAERNIVRTKKENTYGHPFFS